MKSLCFGLFSLLLAGCVSTPPTPEELAYKQWKHNSHDYASVCNIDMKVLISPERRRFTSKSNGADYWDEIIQSTLEMNEYLVPILDKCEQKIKQSLVNINPHKLWTVGDKKDYTLQSDFFNHYYYLKSTIYPLKYGLGSRNLPNENTELGARVKQISATSQAIIDRMDKLIALVYENINYTYFNRYLADTYDHLYSPFFEFDYRVPFNIYVTVLDRGLEPKYLSAGVYRQIPDYAITPILQLMLQYDWDPAQPVLMIKPADREVERCNIDALKIFLQVGVVPDVPFKKGNKRALFLSCDDKQDKYEQMLALEASLLKGDNIEQIMQKQRLAELEQEKIEAELAVFKDLINSLPEYKQITNIMVETTSTCDTYQKAMSELSEVNYGYGSCNFRDSYGNSTNYTSASCKKAKDKLYSALRRDKTSVCQSSKESRVAFNELTDGVSGQVVERYLKQNISPDSISSFLTENYGYNLEYLEKLKLADEKTLHRSENAARKAQWERVASGIKEPSKGYQNLMRQFQANQKVLNKIVVNAKSENKKSESKLSKSKKTAGVNLANIEVKYSQKRQDIISGAVSSKPSKAQKCTANENFIWLAEQDRCISYNGLVHQQCSAAGGSTQNGGCVINSQFYPASKLRGSLTNVQTSLVFPSLPSMLVNEQSNSANQSDDECIAKNRSGEPLQNVDKRYCHLVFNDYTDTVEIGFDNVSWGFDTRVTRESAIETLSYELKTAASRECSNGGLLHSNMIFHADSMEAGKVAVHLRECKSKNVMGGEEYYCIGSASYFCAMPKN